MISRYTHYGLTWIDLESPTREEILHISEEFVLPQTVSEEMFSRALRSKVDVYDKFIYLIVHFPAIDGASKVKSDQEIDFVIGKNFLITTHYEVIEPLHEYAHIFETNSLLNTEKVNAHAGFLFAEMIKEFYNNLLGELELFANDIKKIEHHLYARGRDSNKVFRNESLVKQLSLLNHKLLDYKQSLQLQHGILQSYQAASTRFFGESYSYSAGTISTECTTVTLVLEHHRESVTELEQSMKTLIAVRQSEMVKTLTIITALILPLILISSIFGMNTAPDTLLIRTTHDFFFIIGTLSITALVILLFFRLRTWI